MVGAGTMGRGIAQVAALAGHPVMLYDVAGKNTKDALEFIGQRLEDSFQKGKITKNSKKSQKILDLFDQNFDYYHFDFLVLWQSWKL